MPEATDGDLALTWRLLKGARAHWPELGLVLFFNLLAAPLGLLSPFPLKIALDCVLGGRPVPGYLRTLLPGSWLESHATLLWLACAATFAVLALQALQGFACWVYQLYVGERLVVSARARLFEHMQRLSLRHHDEKGSPDLFYRLQSDVAGMHDLINYVLIPFVGSVVLFACLFVVTFRLDRDVALLAAAALPGLWILSRIYSRRSRRRWADAKETERRSAGAIQEVLGQVRVVKAFAAEAREAERFRGFAQVHSRAYLRAVVNEAASCLLASLWIALASAAALGLGVRHVQTGALSLGNLIVVLAYFAQLFKPVEAMGKLSASFQKSLASAERAFAVLDEAPGIREHEGAVPMERARGDIEFRSVGFSYRPGQEALSGVSFRVAAGQRAAIVGPTGSGKSTLLQLLVRFLDPDEGRITLDGQDIRRVRLSDLRRQFGIVLQEPGLFSCTIAENIAYGRPGAGRSAIEAAAREAEAHDFISRLPEGYDTLVGERGHTLSGGERQRLSLARALLLDAPILVLDEPTSSVDADREEKIAASLERLRRDRTILTVTHRTSLIQDYDLILKLVDGRLSRIERPAAKRSAS
jgi:ATP-binding cassette subfamily B protein